MTFWEQLKAYWRKPESLLKRLLGKSNATQLKLLKQGGAGWNQWREEHDDEEIDLKCADLRGADLRDAHLGYAYLGGAVFQLVNLERANLGGAKLARADLQGANLEGAHLGGAYLQQANLEGANLRGAYLGFAHLENADLQGADLRDAHLGSADLEGAHLRNAGLQGTNLQGGYLQQANLEGADLGCAYLQQANLEGANLRSANLEYADLRFAKLTEANLTGVKLYAAAKDQWTIDEVRCDYVFWDSVPDFKYYQEKQEQQWLVEHRTPKDRDFRPGEFEELYKQLPMFQYVFEHGFTPLDAIVMDRIVAAINEQQPEFDLVLKNFEVTGTPHATFTVLHQHHVEATQSQVTTTYARRILELEAQKDQLMQVIKMLGSGSITIHSVGGNMILQQAQAIEAGNIVAGNQDQGGLRTPDRKIEYQKTDRQDSPRPLGEGQG